MVMYICSPEPCFLEQAPGLQPAYGCPGGRSLPDLHAITTRLQSQHEPSMLLDFLSRYTHLEQSAGANFHLSLR